MLQQPLGSVSDKEPRSRLGVQITRGGQLSGTSQKQQVMEMVKGPGPHLSSAPGGPLEAVSPARPHHLIF